MEGWESWFITGRWPADGDARDWLGRNVQQYVNGKRNPGDRTILRTT